MKKTVIAGLLLATMGLAHAQLSWTSRATEALTAAFDPAPNVGLVYTGSTMDVGGLSISLGAQESARVSFTFLGKEADFEDYLAEAGSGRVLLGNRSPIGTVGILDIERGYNGDLPFYMNDPVGTLAYNAYSGMPFQPNASIGLVAKNFTATAGSVAGKQFQYVLGFNDGDRTSNDWDDLLVGVNVAAVNAVPEPSTYAMLLGGLGAIGFVGARRRQQR